MSKHEKHEKCACGCGGTPKQGKFLPGHDAKVRSKLIEDARGGDAKAKRELKAHGWATPATV